MQASSTRPILMEEITSQQDKVDLCFLCDLEDLSKGVDGILTSYRIFLSVTYVIIGSDEDAKAARREISISEDKRCRSTPEGEIIELTCPSL